MPHEKMKKLQKIKYNFAREQSPPGSLKVDNVEKLENISKTVNNGLKYY